MKSNELFQIMKKQNEITELLIKEQQDTLLPKREIPVFKGDQLQYLTFICTFEYVIEGKTDNFRDCLFFLEQFTEGRPRELVRSCQYMDP